MKKYLILILILFLISIPGIALSQNWYDFLVPHFVDVGLYYGVSLDGANFEIPFGSASPESVSISAFSGVIISANAGWSLAKSFTLTANVTINSLYIPYLVGSTFITPTANTGTYYCTGVSVGMGLRLNTDIFGPFTIFEEDKYVSPFPSFLIYMEGKFKIGYPLDLRLIDSNEVTGTYVHNSIGIGTIIELGIVLFVTEKFGITPTIGWGIMVMNPFRYSEDTTDTDYTQSIAHSQLNFGIAFTFFIDEPGE
jgi:hypothetical protein